MVSSVALHLMLGTVDQGEVGAMCHASLTGETLVCVVMLVRTRSQLLFGGWRRLGTGDRLHDSARLDCAV